MKYNPASGQFMLLILLTIPGLLQYFDSGDCFISGNSITIWLQSTNYPCFPPRLSWWVFKLTFLPPLDTPRSFLFATLKRNIPTLSPSPSPSRLFLCYVWIILIDAHASLEKNFSHPVNLESGGPILFRNQNWFSSHASPLALHVLIVPGRAWIT